MFCQNFCSRVWMLMVVVWWCSFVSSDGASIHGPSHEASAVAEHAIREPCYEEMQELCEVYGYNFNRMEAEEFCQMMAWEYLAEVNAYAMERPTTLPKAKKFRVALMMADRLDVLFLPFVAEKRIVLHKVPQSIRGYVVNALDLYTKVRSNRLDILTSSEALVEASKRLVREAVMLWEHFDKIYGLLKELPYLAKKVKRRLALCELNKQIGHERFTTLQAMRTQGAPMLWKTLAKINLCAMENPSTLPQRSAQEIQRVKKTFEKVFVRGDRLPPCLRGVGWIRRYKGYESTYCLYDVLKYMYGDGAEVPRLYGTYQTAYEAGFRFKSWRMLYDAIISTRCMRKAYAEDPVFAKAFAVLTNGICVRPLPMSEARTQCSAHLKKLSFVVCWLRREAEQDLPDSIVWYMLQYAFGNGFAKAYDAVASMSPWLFEKDLTRERYLWGGKMIPVAQVKFAQYVLKKARIMDVYLPITFANTNHVLVKELLVPSKCLFRGGIVGVGMLECVDSYSLYSVLSYMRTRSYLELLQEGWTRRLCLGMERKLCYEIKNMYSVLYNGPCPEGGRKVDVTKFMGLYALLGAFGASKEKEHEHMFML